MGGEVIINTYSTRLILLARKEVPKEYVYGLLESIYKNRIKLQEKMYKLYKTNKENHLDSLLDPFEMCFSGKDIKYHPGAHNLYKKYGFITYDKNKRNMINTNVKSKLLTENNGPFELLFSRDK
mgnify:FL=1